MHTYTIHDISSLYNSFLYLYRGLFYGQLTVLGYKEYHKEGDLLQSVGLPNEKLILKRRKVPNGISLTPHTSSISYQCKNTLQSTNEMIQLSYPPVYTLICDIDSNNSIQFDFLSDPSYDIYQVFNLHIQSYTIIY